MRTFMQSYDAFSAFSNSILGILASALISGIARLLKSISDAFFAISLLQAMALGLLSISSAMLLRSVLLIELHLCDIDCI